MRRWPYPIAIAVPLAVALSFPHPTRRVLVPILLLLLFVVVLTFVGGLLPGLIAAVSTGASVWYFNVPRAYSFAVTHSDDVVALAMTFFSAMGAAVLVDWMRRRDETATFHTAAVYAQHVADREALVTMQQALLPSRTMPIAQVEVGWCYRAGGTGAAPVGGDWLVFVPLSEHRVGIGVGDVAGHGLGAISAMAQYRFSLRALAYDGEGVAHSLTRLQRVMHRFAPETLASAIYGEIDTRSAEWEFAVAGHPPPLLVRDGRARVLETDHRGSMIGVSDQNAFETRSTPLHHGDLLVLYTDGLVERRREDLDVGIERLLDRVAVITGDDLFAEADAVADDLVGGQPGDDTVVVLVRYVSHAGEQ